MADAFQIASDEDADLKPMDLAVGRRLLPFLWPHRMQFAGALLCVLLATCGNLVAPRLLGRGVDAMQAKDLARVTWLSSVFMFAHIVTFFAMTAQTFLLSQLGQRMLYDLRVELFAHVEQQSLSFFHRWPVGRLVSRISSDVETLAELFSVGLITIVGDVVTIVGVTIVLLTRDLRLAACGISALPVLVATVLYFRKPTRQASRAVRRKVAQLSAFLAERIQGIRVVRAFGAEEEDQARFRAINHESLLAHWHRTHIDAMQGPAVFAISYMAIALVLWQGGEAAAAGRVSVGTLLEFIAYLQWLYQPVRDIAEKYTLLQQAMASSERIVELLDTVPEILEPAEPLDPGPAAGAVELKQVRFSYGAVEGPVALDDVSFAIRPGETVAIVGATGAGKSTIANLIARLWDPQVGAVLLDGVPVNRIPTRELRARVALVLQDVFLFSGTIGENISLSAPGIDAVAVERAARAVAAHDIIERIGGYGARVEERGATLSQGERQLISFARALVRNPAVLVLDEATASIDPATEARLQEGMKVLCAGRTAIVIAHRLATIRSANRVIVLHRGKLREIGTHEELYAQKGIYHQLVELQRVRTAVHAADRS